MFNILALWGGDLKHINALKALFRPFFPPLKCSQVRVRILYQHSNSDLHPQDCHAIQCRKNSSALKNNLQVTTLKICQASARRQPLKPGSSTAFQMCKLMFVLRSHCKNTQHQQADWKKTSLPFLLVTSNLPDTCKEKENCLWFFGKYKNCSKAARAEIPKSISHCHREAAVNLYTVTEWLQINITLFTNILVD